MNDSKGVFITGGASGLGRAIAMRYAAAGWRVCIGDVNDERGAETVQDLAAGSPGALYLRCDVTREEDLQAVAATLQARWGAIDVVVNNAGVALAGSIDEVAIADWQWILDINLMGVVRGCKVFTPVFKNQGHGYFVNVASMAGFLDVPLMSAYNASKAGVVSLSETLQLELRGDNIGVSVICPSFFKTNLTQTMRTTDPSLRKTVNKLFEMGKISAEHIADDIFRAVEKKRFYVLPHPEGRFILFLKRILPRSVYAWLIDRSTRRMRARATPPEE
jgi:NAD(P)-dependent dehydrogenase (short-subunit alcohol dehydrogenase family)